MVHAVGIGLVLQIALATLIANRAVQRVVDQEKLHDAAPRLSHHGAVRAYNHAFGDRISTAGDRFRRFLDFNQAHAAISGDGQTLVIAEARYLAPRLLAGLQNRAARLQPRRPRRQQQA